MVWESVVLKAGKHVWVSTAVLSVKLALLPALPRENVVLKAWRYAMVCAVPAIAILAFPDSAVNQQRYAEIPVASATWGDCLSSLICTVPIRIEVSVAFKVRWKRMGFVVREANRIAVESAVLVLVPCRVNALGKMRIAKLDGELSLRLVRSLLNARLGGGATLTDVVCTSQSSTENVLRAGSGKLNCQYNWKAHRKNNADSIQVSITHHKLLG